jgi:N-methylhydantoinase A
MRYAGQNYEIAVPVPYGPITTATLQTLADEFAAAHTRLYGFAAEDETIQLVTFRIEAAGIVAKASFEPRPDQGPDASGAIVGSRTVWMPEAGGWISCPVYDRAKLDAGNRISGPAIIEQMDATTVVPPKARVKIDGFGYVHMELDAIAQKGKARWAAA